MRVTSSPNRPRTGPSVIGRICFDSRLSLVLVIRIVVPCRNVSEPNPVKCHNMLNRHVTATAERLFKSTLRRQLGAGAPSSGRCGAVSHR